MSNIFKVNNKDTRTMSTVSIANSEHVLHFYSTGSIVEFDQLNVG